jgi:spore coat polysaccharide biosynthesis protein SpsF
MGSTRLPGKALNDIEGRPLLVWTLAAYRAVSSIEVVVVATTVEPADDVLAAVAALYGPVFRGDRLDVLARITAAAAPYHPEFVVRGTADNPFPDPDVIAAQVALCVDGYDYVGGTGYPLGVAAEVVAMRALEAADREALQAGEREHVTPFIYRRPGRFRLGSLPPVTPAGRGRYTVDTANDLALVRELASRIRHGPPVRMYELEAILATEPDLVEINAGTRQRSWDEVEA